jgi:hypothetical protein
MNNFWKGKTLDDPDFSLYKVRSKKPRSSENFSLQKWSKNSPKGGKKKL